MHPNQCHVCHAKYCYIYQGKHFNPPPYSQIIASVTKPSIATSTCTFTKQTIATFAKQAIATFTKHIIATTVNHCFIFEPCKPLLHSSNPLVQCYRDVKALRLIILSYYNYIRLQQICLFSSTISGMHQL